MAITSSKNKILIYIIMPRPKGSTNTKTFDKKVKELIHMELDDELEQKIAIREYPEVVPNRDIPSGNVATSTNFFKLLPPIQQSITGDSGAKYNMRVGNEINLKHIDIDGFLNYRFPLIDSAVGYQDSKLAVRIMIVRAKQFNDTAKAFADMPTNVLIRNGSALSQNVGPYSGFTLDSFRDINRDAFSVRYDKVHYVNAPVEVAGLTSVDLGVIPSSLKLFKKRITFGKKGMKLTFSNQTDTEAENFPYFLMIGYSSMVNSTQPSNGLVSLNLSCVSHYTDA